MQPESNEEREAWDVRHVRRLIGVTDDHAAPSLDALIREKLKMYHRYEWVADSVRTILHVRK